MNNKFLEIFGKIYMVKNDEIIPIEAVKLRDIPELKDIIIITIPEEEIEDQTFTRHFGNDSILRKKMQELKEKAKKEFQKRREQDIKDNMQEHVAVILHELIHAMHNHPNHEWPWKSFDFVHQTAVMMEEAGEAVRAANNMREKGKWQELYNELVQTAAMCLRVMEQIKEYAIRLDKKDSY